MAKVLPLRFTARVVLVQHLLDRSELGNPRVAQRLLKTLAADDYGMISEAILQHTVLMYPRALTDELLLGLCGQGIDSLDLHGCCRISHFAIHTILEQCPNLKTLMLKDCPQIMTPSVFQIGSGLLAPLESVNLENCETVTDATVQMLIRNFPTLRQLNVSWCLNLTDDVFLLNKDLQLKRDTLCKSLRDQLPPYEYHLTSVDMSGCRLLTSRGVRHLVTLCGPTLACVNISYTSADCVSLLYLSGYSLATSLNFATEHGLSVSGHKRLTAFRAESKVELEKLERLWRRYEAQQGDRSARLLLEPQDSESDSDFDSSSSPEDIPLEITSTPEDLSAPEVEEGDQVNPLHSATSNTSLVVHQSDTDASLPPSVSSSVSALANALAGNLSSQNHCLRRSKDLDEPSMSAVSPDDVELRGLSGDSGLGSPAPGSSQQSDEGCSGLGKGSWRMSPERDGGSSTKGGSSGGPSKGKKPFSSKSSKPPGSSGEKSDKEQTVTQVKRDKGIIVRRADVRDLMMDHEWKETDSDMDESKGSNLSKTSSGKSSPGEATPSLGGSSGSSLTKRRSAISPHGERRSSKKSDLHVSFVNVPPDDEDGESRRSGYGSDSSSDHSVSFVREFEREGMTASFTRGSFGSDSSGDPTRGDESSMRGGILRNPTGSSSSGQCKSMRNRSFSLPNALPSTSVVSNLRTHKKRSVSFALGTETQRSRTLPNISLAYFDQEDAKSRPQRSYPLSPEKMAQFAPLGHVVLSADDFRNAGPFLSGQSGRGGAHSSSEPQPSSSHQIERRASNGEMVDGESEVRPLLQSSSSMASSNLSVRSNVQHMPQESGEASTAPMVPGSLHFMNASHQHLASGSPDRPEGRNWGPPSQGGQHGLNPGSSSSLEPRARSAEVSPSMVSLQGSMSSTLNPGALASPGSFISQSLPPIYQSLAGTDLRADPRTIPGNSRRLVERNLEPDAQAFMSPMLDSAGNSELLLNATTIPAPSTSTTPPRRSLEQNRLVPSATEGVEDSAPGEEGGNGRGGGGAEVRQVGRDSSSSLMGDNVLIRSRAVPDLNSPVLEEENPPNLDSSSEDSLEVDMSQDLQAPTTTPDKNADAQSPYCSSMGDNCQLYQPQIISLDVSAMDFFDQAFGVSCLQAFVSANPSLQKLSVSWKFFSDAMLNLVSSNLHELKEISLRECDHLSSGALIKLGRECQKLEKVDLQGICFIGDLAVVPIIHNHRLQWLSLSECEVTEATMRRIAHHAKTNLQELDLCWCEEVSEEGINAVAASCTQLRRLNLRQCNASNLTARLIAENCTHLRSLVLSCVKSLGDAAVVAMAEQLPFLEYLDISWNSDLSDEGIEAILKHCSRLQIAIFSGIKRMSSKPLLPIIADIEQFRRFQTKIRFKFEERRPLTNQNSAASNNDEHEDLHMPHRSTLYAPVLRDLDLAYCDKVDDTHLSEIVAVCRGSMKITDYYGGEVTPILISHTSGPLFRTHSN